MKFFQSELSSRFVYLHFTGCWCFERYWIKTNEAPQDTELFNWLADYIYPVIDNYSVNCEPSADMYPYDYQY